MLLIASYMALTIQGGQPTPLAWIHQAEGICSRLVDRHASLKGMSGVKTDRAKRTKLEVPVVSGAEVAPSVADIAINHDSTPGYLRMPDGNWRPMTPEEAKAIYAPEVRMVTEIFDSMRAANKWLNQDNVDQAYWSLASVVKKHGFTALSTVRQRLVEILIIQRRADEALALLSPRFTPSPDEEDILLRAAALRLSGRTQKGQLDYTTARNPILQDKPSDEPLRHRATTAQDSALLALGYSQYYYTPRQGASKWFFRMVLEHDPRNPLALAGMAHFVDDVAQRVRLFEAAVANCPPQSAFSRRFQEWHGNAISEQKAKPEDTRPRP